MFEINVRGGDDCLEPVTWDREYIVRVPEPLVPEPFIYEILVKQRDGVSSYVNVSYHFGGPERRYAVLPAHTTSMDDHPCVRVRVTDIAGRTVESQSQCDTVGFLDLHESYEKDRETL